MAKLDCQFWDFEDTRGQLQVIRGCPTRLCEELHYLFQRLNEQLAASTVPFEAAYHGSAFLRSLCEQIMKLCGVDHRYVSPLMVRQLLVNPAHLYLINFVSSDESVTGDIEKLTLAESNAQIEAALVASGLVPTLGDAKILTSTYSFEALRAILDAHNDITNPDSPNNKKRARLERQKRLEEDAAVLDAFAAQQGGTADANH